MKSNVNFITGGCLKSMFLVECFAYGGNSSRLFLLPFLTFLSLASLAFWNHSTFTGNCSVASHLNAWTGPSLTLCGSRF